MVLRRSSARLSSLYSQHKTKNMKRVQGSKDVQLLGCTNPVQDKWRIRWDIQTTEDGITSFVEEEFSEKPDIEKIKSVIFSWIDHRVEERIKSGFTYLGQKVWLSQENQFNYKSTYDLAVQTKGKNLPVTFKFGTDDMPYYAKFNTLSELSDFYLKMVAYIREMVENGWKDKDTIDFTLYL